jgi:hypothetical protein
VSAGSTHRAQIKEAVELLKRNDAEIFGCVMTYNRNSKIAIKYAGYYHGKYYKDYQNRYSGDR